MKAFRSESSVILLFALLHVVVTVMSRWQGLSDHLMLTTLTMLMAIVLCQIRKTNVYAMIAILIIVNFAGFYLGRYIGRFLHIFIENTYVRGGITTFLTTVITGVVVCGTQTLFKRKDFFDTKKEIGVYWILLAYIVIIIFRLIIVYINNPDMYKTNTALNVIVDYAFCYIALSYFAVNSVIETRKAQEAKEKSNIAHYSYSRLQQQVKPHFMFNNLNILNGLICNQQVNEASDFVYKLAYLYRYMIDYEEERLVLLREEMDFVNKYVDLMKVRFESSFEVKIDIEETKMSGFVVPCSIQLLIENAIKHNGGTSQTPLMIRVYNTDDHIIVWNNILKKSSPEPSANLGLKYIRELYADITSNSMSVQSNEDEFIVKLPLIN